MKKRLLSISMAAALAFGMTAVVAAPSGAAAPVQKCAHVKGAATITPGLSSTPNNQTVVAKGTLTSCAPTKTTGGSGTINATIKLKGGSCSGLIKGGQKLGGVAKSTWKNHKTSTYALTFTTGKGSAVATATITGKVTAGLFKGHKVSAQIKIAPKSGQTCTPGHPVKNITFVNSKPFQII
jgi:hypothetical protein